MSIGVTEIPFIAYPASDIDKSKDFYERIIGLKCTMDHPLPEEGMRWIEFDVGNTTIAVSNMIPQPEDSGVGAALEVKDLNTAREKLKEEGVQIKTDVMESPGCWFFIIGDPDGNDLTIHQHKPA